jgi:hypothetical protein
VLHPFAELLLLLSCPTIASCDDFGDIVTWDLDFLGGAAITRRAIRLENTSHRTSR